MWRIGGCWASIGAVSESLAFLLRKHRFPVLFAVGLMGGGTPSMDVASLKTRCLNIKIPVVTSALVDIQSAPLAGMISDDSSDEISVPALPTQYRKHEILSFFLKNNSYYFQNKHNITWTFRLHPHRPQTERTVLNACRPISDLCILPTRSEKRFVHQSLGSKKSELSDFQSWKRIWKKSKIKSAWQH